MTTLSQQNQANAAWTEDTVAAIQLLDVFRNSDNDIDLVVDFISQHPALAKETLKRCNSLRFRGAQQITDIFEAVSRLGFYELYSIVSDSLTAQGINLEARAPAAEELEWDNLPPQIVAAQPASNPC